ncbi:hypothetical protein [Sinorhizobium meliloti]|uniref:hypothetical protein n=1 Tax=Rhizobium meliloti TaxID=382 RepID=UPI000FD835F2|nr:hypothetical protein [Sinorhizobium meliloti]RVH21476.1 hypothetical protein CN216_00455 [Sinorhizobium meliloti]RVH21537.1 hypothetical protein CN216_00775 [Sinorhizobium meliloti]
MTEIPDDIMKAANECVAQFRWNNDNRWHLFVARAIMADRASRLLGKAEAPDLLEAAKFLVAMMGDDIRSYVAEAVKDAVAAIAKAEGRS